jgi:uncharacterized membrane protein
MSLNHIQSHVELIARHEQEFLAQRTRAERIGDAITRFAGSIRFVVGQLAFFAAWILWNTLLPGPRRFDPPPFSLLGTIVSMEAILLATLILARQSRMSRRADEREHLMLQILLLSEKEITTALNLERQIARRLGLDRIANAADVQELSQPISIESITETIQENLRKLEEAEPEPPSETALNI